MCTYSSRLGQLLLALSCLNWIGNLEAESVVPYFSPRSQGRNAALHDAGFFMNVFTQDPNPETVHGSIAITPAYTRSFRNDTISNRLFGCALQGSKDGHLVISGSAVENSGELDLLADYFYLSPNFESTVKFSPYIDNFMVDLQFYVSLDAWICGLYFYVYAPLVHTRWSLDICEHVINPGNEPYAEGYFAENAISPNRMLSSFTEYANGFAINDVPNIVFQQLEFAQMSSKTRARTRFSDIIFAFGYNWMHEQDYGLGLSLQACAPTGNRPEAEYLFEPIIGNGHHWEIGVQLYGYYKGFTNCDETWGVSGYFDFNITHQFLAKQVRTFDLINNGSLSRYMLAESMGTPVIDGLKNEDGVVPNGQFQNMFAPVANITSLPVHAHSSVQADLILALVMQIHDFQWEVGYNFWGITKEHLSILDETNIFINNTTWALKGDAQVFGFEQNSTTAIPLSATESRATINHGTNSLNPDFFVDQNANVDNAQRAYNTTGQLVSTQNSALSADTEIFTSINPIFIKATDLNVDAARTTGHTNKLYTHFSYTWTCRDAYIPYLGFGGQVEWGSRNQSQHCGDCSLSQWGIWLKGGFSFE